MFISDYGNNLIRGVGTNGFIRTVAGNGIGGYSGDGGLATNASLSLPVGVAVDSGGNLFFADWWNRRVRVVGTNSLLTTVAGNGGDGYSGDGGPATNATLSWPEAVAADSAGKLFIADINNNRIRAVSAAGIIKTVAGNGSPGYSGDGGSALDASLSLPIGVAGDRGENLFIADFGNNRVRVVGSNGLIATAAGNGAQGYGGDGGAATNASLSWPAGLAVDRAGNLFISDHGNNRIRAVRTNGIITTVAGNGTGGYSGDGGAATEASLNGPFGVAVDNAGNLFIADASNGRVRKVGLAGSPTLTLSSVTTNNSGNYTVIVTGPYGSVTSGVARLTVVPRPDFSFIVGTNGAVRFDWSAATAQKYQVQYSMDLATSNWLNLGTPLTATSSVASASDSVGSIPQKFYRVVWLP